VPKTELNPMEALVIEMSDYYVDAVLAMTKHIAPVRPWWHTELSADEQIWRYLDIREDVMAWVMVAGVALGYESGDEVLANLEDIFTDERLVDAIDPMVAIAVPHVLIEAVQSNGPKEAANWIRRLEKMAEGRAKALGLLEANREVNVPEAPDVPPPYEVAIIDSPGFPLYGGAPTEDF